MCVNVISYIIFANENTKIQKTECNMCLLMNKKPSVILRITIARIRTEDEWFKVSNSNVFFIFYLHTLFRLYFA